MKKILIGVIVLVLAVVITIQYKYSKMDRDPKEYMPWNKSKIESAEKEAKKEMDKKGVKESIGYTHEYWNLKKKILKEKYNIDWKTPAEINPNRLYD